MNKGFIVIFVGIFMMAQVFALGVSPARTTLDFESGMTSVDAVLDWLRGVSFGVPATAGGVE